MSRVLVVVAVFAAICVAAFLFLTASRLNLGDQAKGLLGITAPCADLDFSQLKRDYPKKSGGMGLAFKPYAEALEKCGPLTGKDRRFVRSIFGPLFDSDSRVDSWLIGTRGGVLLPEKPRSMAVFYSGDGLVTRVKIYP